MGKGREKLKVPFNVIKPLTFFHSLSEYNLWAIASATSVALSLRYPTASLDSSWPGNKEIRRNFNNTLFFCRGYSLVLILKNKQG